MDMTSVDGLGFLAAGLVLATFCIKRLVPLRGIAIASNLAFILYGYAARIEPVPVLHLILLPINIIRLLEALSSSSPYSAAGFSTARRRHRPIH
jgi:CRP/FNR family transcriptional regulator, cyclic AMP receptor protein